MCLDDTFEQIFKSQHDSSSTQQDSPSGTPHKNLSSEVLTLGGVEAARGATTQRATARAATTSRAATTAKTRHHT